MSVVLFHQMQLPLLQPKQLLLLLLLLTWLLQQLLVPIDSVHKPGAICLSCTSLDGKNCASGPLNWHAHSA